MRRDLSRACSSCHLRFSVALLGCPACGRKAIPVPEALARVEAPALAAWLAKWAIVVIMVPALGILAWAAIRVLLLGNRAQVQGAADVPMIVFALFAVGVGACLALAIPVGLWISIVTLLRWTVGRVVDRRARMLRVALDRASRRRERAKASRDWLGELAKLRQRFFPASRPWRVWIVVVGALLPLEIVAELFGTRRTLKYSSLEAFFVSLGGMLVGNIVLLGLGYFVFDYLRKILRWTFGYFTGPPALLGFERQPPVLNDALLARWREGRAEVTGRAEPLTEEERAALARHGGNAKGPDVAAAARTELSAPFSRKPCLAFRVAGEQEALPLDDADAISFAVVTPEGRRLVVDAADVVVLLPPRGPAYHKGGKKFLHVRGLPAGDWAARETRLAEGERVRVLGRLASLEVAGGGYRERKRLELLDASDSQPVLIDAPTGD